MINEKIVGFRNKSLRRKTKLDYCIEVEYCAVKHLVYVTDHLKHFLPSRRQDSKHAHDPWATRTDSIAPRTEENVQSVGASLNYVDPCRPTSTGQTRTKAGCHNGPFAIRFVAPPAHVRTCIQEFSSSHRQSHAPSFQPVDVPVARMTDPANLQISTENQSGRTAHNLFGQATKRELHGIFEPGTTLQTNCAVRNRYKRSSKER